MSRLHLVMLAALLALVHCTQATNLVHNVRLATTATCDNHVQSLLNVTEVHWQPAKTGIYLGSPSVVRTSTGALLAAMDHFGPAFQNEFNQSIYRSVDNGATWQHVSWAVGQYWSTLFVRGTEVYTMGTSGTDGDIVIQQSLNDGTTWSKRTVVLAKGSHGYSTGPTPVVTAQGRIWRAFEYNYGSWGSGYHALLVSAPQDSDLMNASNWFQTGGLPFSSVAHKVPANWSKPQVSSNYGWLEGNAVAGPPATPGGPPVMYDVLRVNSLPAANKAALVRVVTPDQPPVFDSFIDFPGGMSKFSIRYDPHTALWITLSNNVTDESIWPQPGCAFAPIEDGDAERDGHVDAYAAPPPCCGNTDLVACSRSPCLWCRGNSRNVLTLNTSPDLRTWRVAAVVMADDTGLQPWASMLYTGFQYVDWQFDGANGDDLIATVRSGYRGANCAHNANRMLFTRVTNWRHLL